MRSPASSTRASRGPARKPNVTKLRRARTMRVVPTPAPVHDLFEGANPLASFEHDVQGSVAAAAFDTHIIVSELDFPPLPF